MKPRPAVPTRGSRPDLGRLFRGVVALVATLGQVSCGGELLGPPDYLGTYQVALKTNSGTVTSLGEVIQFSVRVLDWNGRPVSASELTWASSDANVLVSEGFGRFRSRANGTAVVSVTDKDQRFPETTAQVVVQQKASRIQLTPDTLALYAIGHAVALQARVFDSLGGEIVGAAGQVWSSANPAVATVDPTGMVTATGDGQNVVSLQVGSLTQSATTRVSATLLIGGCVSSDDAPGNACSTVPLTVRAAP